MEVMLKLKQKIRNFLESLPHESKGAIERFYLIRAKKFSLLLHRIKENDQIDVFHDHPWNGISLIFGSYWEETLESPLTKKNFYNKIVSTKYHRVELKGKPVWTLFLHGPRLKGWEFFDRKYNLKINMDWTHRNGREKN